MSYDSFIIKEVLSDINPIKSFRKPKTLISLTLWSTKNLVGRKVFLVCPGCYMDHGDRRSMWVYPPYDRGFKLSTRVSLE